MGAGQSSRCASRARSRGVGELTSPLPVLDFNTHDRISSHSPPPDSPHYPSQEHQPLLHRRQPSPPFLTEP